MDLNSFFLIKTIFPERIGGGIWDSPAEYRSQSIPIWQEMGLIQQANLKQFPQFFFSSWNNSSQIFLDMKPLRPMPSHFFVIKVPNKSVGWNFFLTINKTGGDLINKKSRIRTYSRRGEKHHYKNKISSCFIRNSRVF